MITIDDIASMAGVNKSTVSRVFANPPKIGSEKAQRILKIASQVGYTPNSKIKTLQAELCIGVLVSDLLVNPNTAQLWGNDMFTALINAVGTKGLHIITELYDFGSKRLSIPKIVSDRRVSGVIALGLSEKRAYQKLLECQIPLCCMGFTKEHTPDEIYAVEANCFKGSYDAVSCLAELGHRKIAIIHTTTSHKPTQDKLDGFIAAMKDRNLPLNKNYMRQFDESYITYARNVEITEGLLKLDEPPTAICYANDLSALGGIAAIKAQQLRIPDDVSIIGFDDSYLALQIRPQLSSVKVDQNEMAAHALDLLLKQIAKKTPTQRKIMLETTFVKRDSCGKVKL
jgi:LacI family transcriptional regulator